MSAETSSVYDSQILEAVFSWHTERMDGMERVGSKSPEPIAGEIKDYDLKICSGAENIKFQYVGSNFLWQAWNMGAVEGHAP